MSTPHGDLFGSFPTKSACAGVRAVGIHGPSPTELPSSAGEQRHVHPGLSRRGAACVHPNPTLAAGLLPHGLGSGSLHLRT